MDVAGPTLSAMHELSRLDRVRQRRERPAATSSTSPDALRLQRTAGNRAVAHLLAVQPAQAAPVVQRDLVGAQTRELPVPGSHDNAVVLKDGENVAEGILWVTNVGECKIGLNDDLGGPSTELLPGQQLSSFIPRPGATRILAAAWGDASGRAAVEFDQSARIA